MSDTAIQHTIDIFEHLYNYVQPVIPANTGVEMKQALEQLRGDYSLSIESVEDTMISFGKKVWPYRKSYSEMIVTYEGKLGEQFLIAKLPKEIKKRYEAFRVSGGTLRDLHSGSPALFFTAEERGILCTVLIEVNHSIRDHVAQVIFSTESGAFDKKVKEFANILDDIENRLNLLRKMAELEQEHPQLADEIRSQVRGFELGLCFLGPEVDYEAVCNAEEHFQGRKKDLKLRASVR